MLHLAQHLAVPMMRRLSRSWHQPMLHVRWSTCRASPSLRATPGSHERATSRLNVVGPLLLVSSLSVSQSELGPVSIEN